MGRSSGPPSRAQRGVTVRGALYVGHCTWGGPPGRLHERSEASLYVGHCTWGGPPGRLHERSETSTPREVARPAGQEPRSTIQAAFTSEARRHCTWGTVRRAVLRAASTSAARRPLRAKLRGQRARSPAPRYTGRLLERSEASTPRIAARPAGQEPRSTIGAHHRSYPGQFAQAVLSLRLSFAATIRRSSVTCFPPAL